MNSPPRMVFWMISSTSLTWHFVYSQPSGSMRTSGPISQKPWQPDFFRPMASAWCSVRDTSHGMPSSSMRFLSS